MKAFTAACFFALVLLAVGGASCAAGAAQTNWPAARRPDGKTQTDRAVEARGKKIVVKRERNGKAETREFAVMFDIAARAGLAKAEREKKKEREVNAEARRRKGGESGD